MLSPDRLFKGQWLFQPEFAVDISVYSFQEIVPKNPILERPSLLEILPL
jgi:hypothetical protein